MSFRGEVRDFMREMRLVFIKQKTIMNEQSRMILMLKEERSEMLNRLMARDYPELQTFQGPRYKDPDEADLDFTSDESIAGESVDGETGEVTE